MNNLTEPTLKNLQGDFGIPPKEQNIVSVICTLNLIVN